MGRSLELGSHLRIDRDHHLLFLAHQDVAFLDLVSHPVSELVAKNDGADVDDPLLWNLWQVEIVRQEVRYVGLVAHEVQDALQREIVVLRNEQRLNLVVPDVALLPGHDILDEVDRGVVCCKRECQNLETSRGYELTIRREISLELAGQEVVAFTLRLELCSELLRRDLGHRCFILLLCLGVSVVLLSPWKRWLRIVVFVLHRCSNRQVFNIEL